LRAGLDSDESNATEDDDEASFGRRDDDELDEEKTLLEEVECRTPEVESKQSRKKLKIYRQN
jgi:hypothetical protein